MFNNKKKMRYNCVDCDKKYEIYASFASHRRKHCSPRVVCENCKLKFHTHNALYKHAYTSGCKTTVPVPVIAQQHVRVDAPRPALSLLSGFLTGGEQYDMLE